jgi:hypothetical protein
MKDDKFVSWDEDKQYSLVSGGLFYALTKKLNLIRIGEPHLLRRAVLLAFITWIPMMIITLIDGTFAGEQVILSFIEDFPLHIRLLLVLPFLILIEKIIDPTYDDYMNSTRRLIAQKDEKVFELISDRVDKLSNSWIPEIVFLLIIYGTFFINIDKFDLSVSRWNIDKGDGGIDLAGAYYLFVAIPFYQLLLARWTWRWVVWGYSVIRISKLDLKIEASHADQMAGLEYMGLVPMTFCFLSLAFSAMFSALAGEDIIYNGATLKEYYYPILFFVISIPVVIHLPLLAMIPNLLKAKTRAMNKFSSLIQYHNNLYREKWMEGQLPKDDHILGSLDNSSMADINGSYQQAVKDMSIVPINQKSIIGMVLMLLIPFLPLLFTQYSLKDLLLSLFQVVSG